MADEFEASADQLIAPAQNAFSVSPHATDPLPNIPKALFIGGGGNLVCRLMGDSADVTFIVPTGCLLPVRARYVRATSTCTGIVALY